MDKHHPDNDKTQTYTVLSQGTMVGHYRIIEKIGAGGMGEVYLAEDTKLHRKVALKFLPFQHVANSDFKARFVREAEAMAKLNHPNIITIHEVSEHHGRPFFAMELVEGQSLRELSETKELDIERIIELAIQICDGLGAAHEKQVIHRDIKPSNIVIDIYGRPKVLDFGLAAIRGAEQITKTGSTLGTVRYMSPEQVAGKTVDQRSDLFSVGILLYELLTGRTPFERDNEGATLKAIVSDAPEPLARYKSDVPEGLQRTISKLLEKDPSMRYQNAAGVISDLKPLVISTQSSMAVIPARQKNNWSLIIGGLVILAVLIVAGIKFWPSTKIENTATTIQKRPMVAVIPFENLGGPEDEYFAAGMTDEITSRLAGMPGLGIISRTSAKQYANSNKSLKQIGRELGVDYILEGTVRWSKTGESQRVRITPQLIRVSDDLHLWAENYERELTEVFAVQSDIAINIVEALGVTLLEPEKVRLNVIPTDNLEAYDYYLQANALFGSWLEVDNLKAIDLYRKAVALDPEFAPAWSKLSEAYSRQYFIFADMTTPPLAKQAIDRALEINPNLPQAHNALGYYLGAYVMDYDRALEELRIAEKYLPDHASVHLNFSFVYRRLGKWDKALERARQAMELNPRDAITYWDMSDINRFLGDYKEGKKYIDQAISLDSLNGFYHATKLWDELIGGEGIEGAKEVLRQAPRELDAVALFLEIGSIGYQALGAWRYGIVSPVTSDLPQRFSENYEGSRRHIYWVNMGQIYDLLGDSSIAMIQYDSARVHLESELQKYPEDFHMETDMGIIYSLLGRHEEAIEHSMRAKELLPISDCFW